MATSEVSQATVMEEDKRLISFTERGEEQFHQRASNHLTRLESAWMKVEELMRNTDTSTHETDKLKQSVRNICLLYGEYRCFYRDYVAFLEGSRSVEGQKLIEKHRIIDGARDEKVNTMLNKLEDLKEQVELETRSIASKSRSTKSYDSNSSMKAMVKAETAKVRLFYAEKEAELKKQEAALKEEEKLSQARAERKRSEIEADLLVLKEQKECAEAEAEADIWENSNSKCSDKNSILSTNKENASERTKRYVEENCSVLQAESCDNQEESQKVQNFPTENRFSVEKERSNNQKQLNHAAAEFTPMSVTMATEFSKFLVKKDLLFSRLSSFSDTPEHYLVWKSYFQQIVKEMGVSSSEEFDLLIKWLGPESRKHAVCMKAANSHNPAFGLMKLWKRLDERFGSSELVVASLKKKLATFPIITTKDYKKLYELSDVLTEIESAMENPMYETVLSYFNSSTGVKPIVQKLPYHLQNKWTTRASDYMRLYQAPFPPFRAFCEFIQEMTSLLNNPCFVYEDKDAKDKQLNKSNNTKGNNKKSSLTSFKTGVQNEDQSCLYHNVKGHNLNQCNTFKNKPFNIRKKFFRDKNLCFKCGLASDHTAKTCKEAVKCQVCSSNTHSTALHMDGGEANRKERNDKTVEGLSSACTSICGQINSKGRSCAKIVLVTVHSKNRPNQKRTMYALIDDQSNRSLAKPEFFDIFEERYKEVQYALSSCAGVISTSGRRTRSEDFIVSSFDGSSFLHLPALTECTQIPSIRDEIPTPNSASQYEHLKDIAEHIPPLDLKSDILLLVGRDLPEALHVLDQRIGPRGSPYAQKLHMGWVIVGETCLGKIHQPLINVKKTFVHKNGKCSIFPQCENNFNLKDTYMYTHTDVLRSVEGDIGSQVFKVTDKDDKLGLSIEDKDFLRIMHHEFRKDSKGNWTAPLPFHSTRPRLPNNRNMALNRTRTLIHSLEKNPAKQNHFLQFMQQMLDRGHAEAAVPLTSDTECWYLPIFGIYHPKKLDQIRVVFDSSAKHLGLSLNGVLMTGPDLTNSLLDILMRFRKEPIAISADIQQMFYQFFVDEKDRDYLRFFWFKNNDPNLPLVEYRMCVHVFGNSPSPAIATFGLRQTPKSVEKEFGSDVTDFVNYDFYVDDGLTSLPNVSQAVDLMQRTQAALAKGGNIKLHKVSSNSRDVMNAFPKEDLAGSLKDLDIGHEGLPTQRSLGLNWNLDSDTFTFKISDENRPCTRRGILSTLNSLFDPLGFIAPVVIHGRIIMRDLVSGSSDWDEPLPFETRKQWLEWCKSLKFLETLSIPRSYLDGSLSNVAHRTVHVFSDASEKAISAVAYLRTVDSNDEVHVGFIMGKSKVSPKHGHTIPRLELCAAVMAVELAYTISEHLRLPVKDMTFYTDSRVVLGYIYNKVRRFYVYVENRVSRILKHTSSEQWNYVASQHNPADLGTRAIPVESFESSIWLCGPSLLFAENYVSEETFELHTPSEDPEIRPGDCCLKTSVDARSNISTSGFKNISRWERLLNAIVVWKRFAQQLYNKFHVDSDSKNSIENSELQKFAHRFIITLVQKEEYGKEIESIQKGLPLQKNSSIIGLSPYIDDEGLLRVGGRLKNSDMKIIERNPIILPGKCYVSRLLVSYYHERTRHQGRQITEGAIREAGYWITGVKRLIMSVIHPCVKCQRLRGKQIYQRMADLPEDRLIPVPPFTSVGLDCFGPWQITSRRMRGGQAQSKRWAVLFTCLTSRAVHIEVIEELSNSSFINALRRFTSIRGKAKIYRSDRGTNFIGALDDLGVNISNNVRSYLNKEGSTWILNPPHSSHRGGVWERMIGVTRRILDSLLLDLPGGGLTHEVLTTFLAEVSAIINSRPLVPLLSDTDNPSPLSPSLLLTQKSDCIVDVVIPSHIKDMYKAQWKRVQILSERFWKRWRSEYLQTLQIRKKWTSKQRELRCGDVVLLRDKQVVRNDWPMGVIVRVIPSTDGHVRTAEVRTASKDGKTTIYQRPVNEMMLLISTE